MPQTPEEKPSGIETIFDGKSTIIPMLDVSHIEKIYIKTLTVYEREKGLKVGDLSGITIVTKHTTWNAEQDYYNNPILLKYEEAQAFLKAWCQFRHDYENLTPSL